MVEKETSRERRNGRRGNRGRKKGDGEIWRSKGKVGEEMRQGHWGEEKRD